MTDFYANEKPLVRFERQATLIAFLDEYAETDKPLFLTPKNERFPSKEVREFRKELRLYAPDIFGVMSDPEIDYTVHQVAQGSIAPNKDKHAPVIHRWSRSLYGLSEKGVSIVNEFGSLSDVSLPEAKKTRPWGTGNNIIAFILVERNPQAMNGVFGRWVAELKHRVSQSLGFAQSSRNTLIHWFGIANEEGADKTADQKIGELYGVKLTAHQLIKMTDEEIWGIYYGKILKKRG